MYIAKRDLPIIDHSSSLPLPPGGPPQPPATAGRKSPAPGASPGSARESDPLDALATALERRRRQRVVEATDAQRLDRARAVARRSPTARAIVARLDADGVPIELVADDQFRARHGDHRDTVRLRAMKRVTTRLGTVRLSHGAVIRVARSAMADPRAGALLLAHQGAWYVLEQPRVLPPELQPDAADPACLAVGRSSGNHGDATTAALVRGRVALELGLCADNGNGTRERDPPASLARGR